MIAHEKGKRGENEAASFLKAKGYKILKRNFMKPCGEVDIIAIKGYKIVFCEVKNWDYIAWEDLHYSINKSKILRMQTLARLYILENPEFMDYEVGFDLVLLSRRMEEPDHIEDFI